MTQVEIHGKRFKRYIGEATIQQRVAELATQIDKDYEGLRPLFLSILNGSFIFAADLFKRITTEAEISFIKLASYEGIASTGQVVKSIGLEENLKGRHIILLEDIIDTGRTLHSFLPEIMQQHPASLKIATFLSKPEALQFPVFADYKGFEIPNHFVVGYGLDYDGLGRNMPELYTLEEE